MPGSISKIKMKYHYNHDEDFHNMATQQVAVKKQNNNTEGKSDEELHADIKHSLIVTHNRAHLASGSHMSKRAYVASSSSIYSCYAYFWYLPYEITNAYNGYVLDKSNCGWWINSNDAKGYPDPPFPYWGICGSYNTINRSYESELIVPMVPFYFIYANNVSGQNWGSVQSITDIDDMWSVIQPNDPNNQDLNKHDIRNFSYFPVIYVDGQNNKHAVYLAIAKNTVSYSNLNEIGNIAGKSNYYNLIQLFSGSGMLTDGTYTASINAYNPTFAGGHTVNNSTNISWYGVNLNPTTYSEYGRTPDGNNFDGQKRKREKTTIYWPENYTFSQYGYPNN
jgi:hypothetical protein